MQTHLVGRDMITTQEWTRDELDTVFEVAKQLKMKRALGEPHAVWVCEKFDAAAHTRAAGGH